ncbi:MAG TPA: ATP-binding protein [Vicinamibacteria bacterium]|nr:ATP-binding protein [Vicinamibacteria bacterium]
MSFKGKLLAAFFIMAVPLAVIAALALLSVRKQTAAVQRLQASLARARTFSEVESATYRKIRKIREHLSGQDPMARRDFQGLDQLSSAKFSEWKATAIDADEQPFIRSFEELDAELDALAEKAFSLSAEGHREEAAKLVQEELNGRILPSLDGLNTTIYINSRTRNIHRAVAEVESTARSTSLELVGIAIASMIFSGLFSISIARNLARPIERLKAAMDGVGEGEFDRARSLNVGGRDEVGDLARAFVRMAERLHGTQEDLRHKIETLRETQSQLIQSEKLASLGQMAAAVAHGLRNPLASIRAATQLSLFRLPSDSSLREHLTAVIDEVDRLERRIVHLLDFARPTAFAPAPTSLRRLVEDSLGVFEEKIAKQGVTLKLDLGESIPETWVDASQVEQAIIEVVANALESMPSGGSLTLAAELVEDSGVRLTIEDTGAGIPKDALSRVAEPFFTTRADGTGLGLAIAKRFVEQNKGTFEISSVERKGTVVTIRLTTAHAAAPATAAR